MSQSTSESEAVFRYQFVVPKEAIDGNGHVNNVVYIQWMQDIAMRHSDACGGTAALEATEETWVVRSHLIEYLTPAREGDLIEARTWVANFRRVGSLRRTEFERISDKRLVARGATEWVCVNEKTGRPSAIPAGVREAFPVLRDPNPK
jgi:acyl-CoA thioester hydrolase